MLLSAPLLWAKDHDDPRAFPPHILDPLTGTLVQYIASDKQCAGSESLGVNAPHQPRRRHIKRRCNALKYADPDVAPRCKTIEGCPRNATF